MGIANVAPSDSTIEVVHHMSKFNIFIISLDFYCSDSCMQLHIVVAFSPAGKCYCSHFCRQTLHIIARTPLTLTPILTLTRFGRFRRFRRYEGAPSMGLANVAPSDSTIEVDHRSVTVKVN